MDDGKTAAGFDDKRHEAADLAGYGNHRTPDREDRTPLPPRDSPFIIIDDPASEDRPPEDELRVLVERLEAYVVAHGGTLIIRQGARHDDELLDRVLGNARTPSPQRRTP